MCVHKSPLDSHMMAQHTKCLCQLQAHEPVTEKHNINNNTGMMAIMLQGTSSVNGSRFSSWTKQSKQEQHPILC